jgi:hypothetical protein
MERYGGNRVFRRSRDRSTATAALGFMLALFVGASRAAATDDHAEYASKNSPAEISTGVASSSEALTTAVFKPRSSPWIQNNMDPQIREKILEATKLALQRIEEIPECAEMFAALGADGTEVLTATLYFPVANSGRRVKLCPTSSAHTVVGASATWLCPEFKRLPVERAALVLIHEALHHAGLTEHPVDPKGMTSLAINRMVKKNCGF